jgi:hypothetical protein
LRGENLVSRKTTFKCLALSAAAFALVLGLSAASALPAEQGAVTITVTAVGKKDVSAPAVKKEDVQFFLNKERTQIADWQRGEKLYLAVLIDDSLDSSVASQWGDLKEFFNAQPQSTYISVAYARNGSAMLVQDFTNDHELAAKALRLPMGGGAFSSPYLAPLRQIAIPFCWFLPGSTTSTVISPRVPISIPPSSTRRNRTSTCGRSMLPMPDTGRADSSLLGEHSRISASSPRKQALNPIISVPARRFPSSLILMSSPRTSATSIF